MGSDLRAYTLAHQINQIKRIIFGMDLVYAKEAAQSMIDQGNWQDSAAVLNPTNPLEANDLLRLQGEALFKMVEFIELLKMCEEGKEAVKKAKSNWDDIEKLFQ